MRNGFLEWRAYERTHSEKSSDWYWAVGIIAVSAAVTSIIFGNVLFAIVILLGAFVLTVHTTSEPPLRRYKVTERGVHIDDTFYPYTYLDAFWVEEPPKFEPRLIIRSKKYFTPLLILPLPDDMDTDVVHDYMLDYLDAEELHESIVHKLFDYLGF